MYHGKQGQSGLSLPWMQNMESGIVLGCLQEELLSDEYAFNISFDYIHLNLH